MKILKTVAEFVRGWNPVALRRDIASLKAAKNMFGKLAHEALALGSDARLELEMTDDLLDDAAQVARRYEKSLAEMQAAIAAVATPNGTTRKLARLVDEALAGTQAKLLAEAVKDAA